jgi:hypothetical protein
MGGFAWPSGICAPRALRKLRPGICANHQINASRALNAALGLPDERSLPWDWPALMPHPDPKS